jgi:hypothetical protein
MIKSYNFAANYFKQKRMESFKFHENDVTVMKQFYQRELEKTMKHLQHIKSVLESLGDKATQILINVKGSAKALSVTASDASGVKRGPGRPRKTEAPGAVAKTIKTRGKKRGPESVWGTFILDKLKDSDKPMTYQHLVDAAMSKFGLTEAKRKATSDAIINAAFRLRKNAKKIDTFSAGQREKHVALKSWFDAPGKIGAVYMDKAKSDVVKPKAVKSPKAPKAAKTVKVSIAAKPKGKVGRPAKTNKIVKPAKVAVKKATATVVSSEPKKRGRKPNLQLQKLKEVIKQVKSGSSSGSANSAAKVKSTVAKKVAKPVVKKVVVKAAPKADLKVKTAAKKVSPAKVALSKPAPAKAKVATVKASKKPSENKK